MKNPVPALVNTEDNRKELENITPEIWETLSNSKKLGRIALHETIRKLNLLKIKYDKDKIIKDYNREKNSNHRKRNEESLLQDHNKKIDKLEEQKSELEEERDSLQEDNNKLRENNEILEKNFNIINRRYNRVLKKIEDRESSMVSCNESKEKHKEKSKVLKEKIDILEMEISRSREFESSVKSDVQEMKNEITRLNNEITRINGINEASSHAMKKKDEIIMKNQMELSEVKNSMEEINHNNESLLNEMSQFKIEKDHLASNFRNIMSAHSLTSYKNNIIEQGIRSVLRKMDQNSLNRKEIDALRQELNELIFIGNFTSNVQC